MGRIQPVLTEAEAELVNQMAALTRTKRTEVIKNALTVYHWFIRQAVTGARVVARKPSGEEVALETAELAALEGSGQLMTPAELRGVAARLARASDHADAARLRERLTRGFYGI